MVFIHVIFLWETLYGFYTSVTFLWDTLYGFYTSRLTFKIESGDGHIVHLSWAILYATGSSWEYLQSYSV